MKPRALLGAFLLGALASCGAVLSTEGGQSDVELVTPLDLIEGVDMGMRRGDASECAALAAEAEDESLGASQRQAAVNRRAAQGCSPVTPAG